jgi:predicted metalloprotease with PDZ domain
VAVPARPKSPVHYSLSPVIENGALRSLEVGIDLNADVSGLTRLSFPPEWAGENRLGQWSEGFAVEGATSVKLGDNGSAEITSAPGAALHIRYRVHSAFGAPPTVSNGRQPRPIITPTWFYAVGEVLFALPEGRENASVQFDWIGAPAGFGFASDLEHLAGSTRAAKRPGTVADLAESIVVGGSALQIVTGTGADAGVRAAIIGGFQTIQTAPFADLAFRIIRTERQFWGERGDPFLVTLAPLVTESGTTTYSGAGRSDAFAVWAGSDTPLGTLRGLLAHEYFHTWNPGALGGFGEDGASERPAWVAEGFTEFYANRLALRSGVYALDDYVAAWNRLLLAYGISPARNAPETRIATDFWTDPAVKLLPYQRGAILAALFDADIRRASRGTQSLDTVARRMRQLAPRTSRRIAVDGIFGSAFTQVTGRRPTAEIERYELRGETVLLPPDTFACLKLETVDRPTWDQGFDGGASRKTGMFTGVNPDGPAYAAGLRDGMKRLALVSGEQGNSTVDLVYRVVDLTGAERVIRYKPAGTVLIHFQRLAIPERLTEIRRRACIRTLSGG